MSNTEDVDTGYADSRLGVMDTLRKPKLFGIAVFDVCATFGTSVALAYLIKYLDGIGMNMFAQISGFHMLWFILLLFVILMVSATAVHYATGTPTMLNYYLGINTLDDVLKSRK